MPLQELGVQASGGELDQTSGSDEYILSVLDPVCFASYRDSLFSMEASHFFSSRNMKLSETEKKAETEKKEDGEREVSLFVVRGGRGGARGIPSRSMPACVGWQ